MQVQDFNDETSSRIFIQSIVSLNTFTLAEQQQQQSLQTVQVSNQAPQESNQAPQYCSLGSILDPFTFPIGEHNFKIDFDLRINLGRTHEYEAVLVDCEPNSDYPLVFESQFMLRFTNIYILEISFKI